MTDSLSGGSTQAGLEGAAAVTTASSNPAIEAAPAAAAAPAADSTVSPANNTSGATQSDGSTAGAAPAVEPAKADAPAADPAKAAEPAAEPQKDTSLLGGEKVETKPAEGADDKKNTEGEAKPEDKKDESSQSVDPAPLPTYDEFKLPEGITLNDSSESLGTFNKILGEFESGEKTHESFQKFGQDLVNYHVTQLQNSVQKVADEVAKTYSTQWENQRNGWKESFMKDPEIGGNKAEVTLNAAKDFLATHGGTPEQQVEFKKFLDETGVGNHPSLIRLLANASAARPDPGMLAAKQPVPQKKSKIEALYGKRKAG